MGASRPRCLRPAPVPAPHGSDIGSQGLHSVPCPAFEQLREVASDVFAVQGIDEGVDEGVGLAQQE